MGKAKAQGTLDTAQGLQHRVRHAFGKKRHIAKPAAFDGALLGAAVSRQEVSVVAGLYHKHASEQRGWRGLPVEGKASFALDAIPTD